METRSEMQDETIYTGKIKGTASEPWTVEVRSQVYNGQKRDEKNLTFRVLGQTMEDPSRKAVPIATCSCDDYQSSRDTDK